LINPQTKPIFGMLFASAMHSVIHQVVQYFVEKIKSMVTDWPHANLFTHKVIFIFWTVFVKQDSTSLRQCNPAMAEINFQIWRNLTSKMAEQEDHKNVENIDLLSNENFYVRTYEICCWKFLLRFSSRFAKDVVTASSFLVFLLPPKSEWIRNDTKFGWQFDIPPTHLLVMQNSRIKCWGIWGKRF